MRRCFTPNPHTKTRMLSELLGNQIQFKNNNSLQIDYDNFIFVDRITNHKICIGDAKNKYGCKQKKNTLTKTDKKPVSSRGKVFQKNRQIQQINQCWNFMKTTKIFQMQSLKSKIFNKNSDNDTNNKQNQKYDDMNKKKKNLRQFIEQYIHDINIKQFRNYVKYDDEQNRKKHFNQKIVNLWKHIPSKLNLQNIQKIIQEILESEQKKQKKVYGEYIGIDDIHFPDQQKIQTILMNRAFVKNRDFQYLIHPKSSTGSKKVHKNTTKSRYKNKTFNYESGIKNMKFPQNQQQKTNHKIQSIENNWVNKNQRYIPKTLKNKQKNLILAVQNGLIYDLLFFLIRWPILINATDQKGNNLLHIAAKKNQIDAYQILIKKMGNSFLNQKNNYGKTPIDIAKMFNSIDIIQKNKDLQGLL